MKRERATALMAEMVDRLEGGAWPLGLVKEVYVFGSYARGALNPGDVDVVVQHGTDEKWLQESLHASVYGSDSYTSMKQALRGRRRGVCFQFQGRDSLREEGFELTLLWQQGEPFELARQRLAAIAPDPAAGRAPRDFMLPQFESVEERVPRPARIDLHRLHSAGEITLRTVPLPVAEPVDPRALRHLDRRWQPTSPLRRSAAAALAHLESEGVSMDGIHLHAKRLTSRDERGDVTCFVDLGWHHFHAMVRYLADGQAWFEVLPSTTTQPLHALHVTPVTDRRAGGQNAPQR